MREAVFFSSDSVETASVGSRAEWDEITAVLRAAPDPYACAELGQLWALALEEAPRVLASFRVAGKLDDERIADLTRDFLVEDLRAILENAVNPRAYFVVAIQNSARSWLRRGSARIAPTDYEAAKGREPRAASADPAELIDAQDFLRGLTERERDVLAGLAAGVDREELARALGTSRANVDQIASRVRARFRREDR